MRTVILNNGVEMPVLGIGTSMMEEEDCEEEFEAYLSRIRERYDEIISGLGLSLDLSGEFKVIRENFMKKTGRDYAASRGEYLNGRIMAEYLGYTFIDAADVIFFDEDGNFDAEKTDQVLGKVLAET